MYKHIPLLPNSMITMNTLKLFLCVCLMPGFSLYNPQNEMFRLLGTKRSFSQNETFFFSHP